MKEAIGKDKNQSEIEVGKRAGEMPPKPDMILGLNDEYG